MTEYVILEQGGETGKMWHEVARIKASGATVAIRAYANGGTAGSISGTCVAVPLRSWQPKPVVVETERRVKIG